MVLIYDKMHRDPRIEPLSDAAFTTWLSLVRCCSHHGRETVTLVELSEALLTFRPGRLSDIPDCLAELALAELVEIVGLGDIKALARLDLWAFEHEVPPEHITGEVDN